MLCDFFFVFARFRGNFLVRIVAWLINFCNFEWDLVFGLRLLVWCNWFMYFENMMNVLMLFSGFWYELLLLSKKKCSSFFESTSSAREYGLVFCVCFVNVWSVVVLKCIFLLLFFLLKLCFLYLFLLLKRLRLFYWCLFLSFVLFDLRFVICNCKFLSKEMSVLRIFLSVFWILGVNDFVGVCKSVMSFNV